MHPACVPLEDLLRDCRVERFRASGPGGQHRNKVETAVRLRHTPSGCTGEATESRSAQLNQERALQRLRLTLAVTLRSPNATVPSSTTATETPPAAVTPPASPLWRERTAHGRLAVNADHPDLPALIAEALDHLAACDWDAGAASECLQVSSSQLVRLLKGFPPAFGLLNRERRQRGLRGLR